MIRRPLVLTLYALAAVAGLLVAVIVADRLVLPVLVRQGQAIKVPDVAGLRPEEAKRVLRRSRLNLVVAGEKHDATVAKGTLCAQAPEAGSSVKSRRNIRALLSLGTRQMTMPLLAGLPLDHARMVLSTAGLSLRKVLWTPSSRYPSGATIASSPASGDTVGAGETVDLLVSGGAPPASYVLPDLRGRMIEEVVPLLQLAGLEHQSVRRDMGFGADPGLILQQQPRPGSMVSEGDTLTLWLPAEGRG